MNAAFNNKNNNKSTFAHSSKELEDGMGFARSTLFLRHTERSLSLYFLYRMVSLWMDSRHQPMEGMNLGRMSFFVG